MAGKLTRRDFLRTSAAAATVVAGGSTLSAAPERKKVRFAIVGCGGRGRAHLGWAGSEKIVALCDTDAGAVAGAAKRSPDAKTYSDYRKLFEHANDFDAVVVATPDHNHYFAVMRALKAGKHVYCEKPLTWGVWEAQQLEAETRKQKVATQMGNQGNAGQGWRIANALIKEGGIGAVKEAHTWTNRPIWPQGIGRPEGADPIPDSLDWNAWIGPAPMRPFKKGVYHGFKWRGWLDFGAGALGDMACHTMNVVFQAMTPGYPTRVEPVSCSGRNNETFPKSEVIKWVFPATSARPGFDAYWYDGGKKPPRPAELEEGRKLPGTGCMFVGTKGTMLIGGDYNNSPQLIPESKRKAFGKPKTPIVRSVGHSREFLLACRGEKPWDYPKSNFTYAGPMTAVIVLGIISQRVGKTLDFDPTTLKFTNSPEANALLKRTPRSGWDV